MKNNRSNFAVTEIIGSMILLLIVVGTFSTTISVLPQSGIWMLEVKKFFGFVLLAMCVYVLQPFIGVYVVFKMYAVLSFIAAIYYFATSKESKIKILIGLLLLVLAVILLSKGMAKRSKLLACNLKPDTVLVCLSTDKNKSI